MKLQVLGLRNMEGLSKKVLVKEPRNTWGFSGDYAVFPPKCCAGIILQQNHNLHVPFHCEVFGI